MNNQHITELEVEKARLEQELAQTKERLEQELAQTKERLQEEMAQAKQDEFDLKAEDQRLDEEIKSGQELLKKFETMLSWVDEQEVAYPEKVAKHLADMKSNLKAVRKHATVLFNVARPVGLLDYDNKGSGTGEESA